MRILNRALLVSAFGGLTALVAACPASLDDRCANGTCDPSASSSSGEGGTDGGGDSVPPGCDPAADSNDQKSDACATDDFGMFVDAAGAADAPGTRSQPVKTIALALAKRGTRSRIYVCEGSYPERISLQAAVTILGGFTCGSWSFGSKPTLLRPTESGPAVEIRSVQGAFTISDIDVLAPSGSSASPSSVAAFVSNTPALTLRRTRLAAQTGASGKSADPGTNGALVSSTPQAATLNGTPGSALLGGASQACTCSNGGTTAGGRGGDPGGVDKDGQAGTIAPVAPATFEPPTATGQGSTRDDCEMLSVGGRVGSAGASGADGDGAKATFGDVTSDGWLPAAGNNGKHGIAGQGGGGGGGSGGAGGGGSGACGGCGGHGGEGGGGGGGSIAILALNSPITLVAVELKSARAGNGGNGGTGGDGMDGGMRANPTGGGCFGGNGGKGGKGGAGGGGRGGLAGALIYKGAKPIGAPVVTKGTKGDKGQGGSPGNNDGLDGDAVEQLEIK